MADEEKASVSSQLSGGKKNDEPTTKKDVVEKINGVDKRFYVEESKNDLHKPVLARMKNYVREIQKRSSARHEKIMRGATSTILTEPPLFHISKLNPKWFGEQKATVTFYVYKDDGAGNKFIAEEKSVDDNGKERVVNATPVLNQQILVIFEPHKPAKYEIFNEGEL